MEKNFLALENTADESLLELYMTFKLADKNYAIKAEKINEIVQLPNLSLLEKLPDNIIGLMNLKGRIISVIDVRSFLGLEVTPYTTDNQVLIINTEDKTIGIIVDSVNDVVQFDQKDLEKLPYSSHGNYIYGAYNHQDSLVAFLNIQALSNSIKKLEIEEHQLNTPAKNASSLFPQDEISQDKFNKRAIKLQKEIKNELAKNDYIEDRFVSFSLNHEIYCINLKYVKEFTKLKNINLTPIPCVPEYFAGLVNLRGEFINIIDIKSFLKISKTQITDKSKIIVVKTPNLQVGLLVDEVFDMVNIQIKDFKKEKTTPFDKDKFTIGEIIQGDGTLMNILNLEKLLEDERLYFEDAI